MTNDHERFLEEWWKASMPPGITAAREQYFKEWWKIHRPLILQRALIEFREAYLGRAETGELAAYIEAIRILGGVLMYLEEPLGLSDDDPAYRWWCDLRQHLTDLSIGIVPPAFNCPVRIKGLTTVKWLEREKVVHAIELLRATGMTYDAAARKVIRGYKLNEMSEKEILSWRREFKKRNVKNSRAVEWYDEEMAWLHGASAKELQRAAAHLFEEKAFVSELLSREVLDRQVKAALLHTPKPPRGE